jgi:hypothetical protein
MNTNFYDMVQSEPNKDPFTVLTDWFKGMSKEAGKQRGGVDFDEYFRANEQLYKHDQPLIDWTFRSKNYKAFLIKQVPA